MIETSSDICWVLSGEPIPFTPRVSIARSRISSNKAVSPTSLATFAVACICLQTLAHSSFCHYHLGCQWSCSQVFLWRLTSAASTFSSPCCLFCCRSMLCSIWYRIRLIEACPDATWKDMTPMLSILQTPASLLNARNLLDMNLLTK